MSYMKKFFENFFEKKEIEKEVTFYLLDPKVTTISKEKKKKNEYVSIQGEWVKKKKNPEADKFHSYFDREEKSFLLLKKARTLRWGDIYINFEELKKDEDKRKKILNELKEKLDLLLPSYERLLKSYRALENSSFTKPEHAKYVHEEKKDLLDEISPIYREYEVYRFIYNELKKMEQK